jgi:hypothetical protein
MNAFRIPAFMLLASMSLLACSNDAPTPAAKGQEEPGLIGKAVREATDKAREELATKNIELQATGQPKAEITPQGDLLIGGKPVAADAAQHKLLQDYRANVAAIAEAGIDIGVQGADLAGKAVTEALVGVFTGKSDEIEKKIEGQADGIKASAAKLCTKLPALLDTQNRLAASLPAFKPYASMTQQDIDDCNKDGNVSVNVPGMGLHGGFTQDDNTASRKDDAAGEAETAAQDAAKDTAAGQ